MNTEGRGALRAWLSYLFIVLLIFVFQETVFRFVFPLPEISNFNRVNYSRLFQDQTREKLQPLSNAAFTWASDPDGVEFVHHLNLYGFRDTNWPTKDGQRVMFIGDSFTEGFMAADDETIPRGFELAATKHGNPIETINLGTGASGMGNYLELIGDAVPMFLPHTVVLVLYANDFSYNKAGDHVFDSVSPLLRTNRYLPRVYDVITRLVNKDVVATRWSKPPFQFLPTAESKSNPLNEDAFVEYAQGFVSPEILGAMKQGRFNPFVINEYTNYEAFLSRPTDMVMAIEPVKKFVESHGSRLLVVHIPYKGQVSDNYLEYVKQYDENKQPVSLMADAYQIHGGPLRAECEELDVPYLDMTTILREQETRGKRMYWNYDEHMKAAAYLMIGEKIYGLWQRTLGAGLEGS